MATKKFEAADFIRTPADRDRYRIAAFRLSFGPIHWYTADEINMKCDWCDTPLIEAGHATLGICYGCAVEEGII